MWDLGGDSIVSTLYSIEFTVDSFEYPTRDSFEYLPGDSSDIR